MSDNHEPWLSALKDDPRTEAQMRADYYASIAELKEPTGKMKDDLLVLADEFEKSVGLFRKMPDGRMVEVHLKKVALIQTALRNAGGTCRFPDCDLANCHCGRIHASVGSPTPD